MATNVSLGGDAMDKMLNLLNLRLKIMFSHKSFWIIYALITFLVVILVSQLYNQVDQGVKIPVGIVDEDNSKFSEYVVDRLKENHFIDAVMLESASIESYVKEQKVEAVYIIKENAEKKVVEGNLKSLIEVVYLDENYFTMMLTDILSGDFLDEICLIIASRYYNLGYKELVDENYKSDIYNEVYREGQNFDSVEDNYYLNIELVGDNNQNLEFYNQSIVLEKMTIGISYIFIAFFILFEGLHILKDRELLVYKKISISGLSVLFNNTAELLSIIIAGLMMSVPFTILTIYFGKSPLFMIFVNTMYVISMSSFVYIFLHVIRGINSYILLGTSVIIGIGIISGSFFTINIQQPMILFIAKLFPTYYSVNVYFDKALIREYSIYTSIYLSIIFLLCIVIDRKLIKE